MKVMVLVLVAMSAWAQAPQSAGSIQGDLVDSTGAAVSGVAIRATNQASHRAVLQTGFEAFNLANDANPAPVSQFYAAGVTTSRP